MAGHLVFFATMNDEPDASFAVGFHIARGYFFWRAVHHDVGCSKQVVEPSGHVKVGLSHGQGAIRVGGIKRETLRARHAGAPVGGDIRHANEVHVLLCDHCVCHTFADHAVSVYGNSDRFHVSHLALLNPVPVEIS